MDLTISITQERLEELVTEALVRQLGFERDDDYRNRLIDAAETRVAEKLAKLVDRIAEKAVTDFIARPMQTTSQFGEPVGPPQTFAQRITAHMEAWCSTPVNEFGKPEPSYSRKMHPRIEHVIAEAVGAAVDVAATTKIKAAALAAKEQVLGVVQQTCAETMRRLLKVE
jgi:hypothetical protein